MNYNFVTTEPIFKIRNSAESYCLAEFHFPSPIFPNLTFSFPPPARAKSNFIHQRFRPPPNVTNICIPFLKLYENYYICSPTLNDNKCCPSLNTSFLWIMISAIIQLDTDIWSFSLILTSTLPYMILNSAPHSSKPTSALFPLKPKFAPLPFTGV